MMSASTIAAATSAVGTISQAIATPYSRSACSACRKLPVAPSTNSGTIATRAMIASTVLAAVNIA